MSPHELEAAAEVKDCARAHAYVREEGGGKVEVAHLSGCFWERDPLGLQRSECFAKFQKENPHGLTIASDLMPHRLRLQAC